MSYDNNPYSTPENFNLEPLGEIDFSTGCYEFNITAVWRRKFDGRIVLADDSGCSCPAPFEDTGPEELTVVTPAELQAHLEQCAEEAYRDESEEADRWAFQIASLMTRVVDGWHGQAAA